MDLEERINVFLELGHFLSQFSREGIEKKDQVLHNDLFFEGFKHQIKLAEEHNGWFTTENILFAIENWSNLLTKSNIKLWIEKYNFNTNTTKKIAVIMAGNIPMVGFHDFLSVLLTGHDVLIKQSSNDKHLLPFIAKYIQHIESRFKGAIEFTEEKLTNFDAVIATGSNNTARYFEYYFKNKPAIIRKNRNSVAILTGKETKNQLELLSEDIFRYYGLGCRNVSKLFVPKDYNFDPFFNAMYVWRSVINQTKYANNYDYNKAVYLMSEFEILDNGFMMIKEDKAYASPIATVFFEYYKDKDKLKKTLQSESALIQCVVADNFSNDDVLFGKTQKPKLWHYADGVDTVDFLLKI